MKISFHQISLVVIAVATSFGYSASVSAQQLRAENIDEVVKALTLEEKCHLVLGRGMHFNDDAKFPGDRIQSSPNSRTSLPIPCPTLNAASRSQVEARVIEATKSVG